MWTSSGPKFLTEGDVLFHRDILTAKQEYLVFVERPSNLVGGSGIDILPRSTPDTCAPSASDRRDHFHQPPPSQSPVLCLSSTFQRLYAPSLERRQMDHRLP